ncbi:hypothetical protein LEN26_020380 [Aphanomyces euteiches]|nr:hypothetical protein LEN26_020380 [Aphanomyces euteiches]KAH9126079.1 hypothetical protein AeMF1_003438 [Aphanomyces euteiches]KAH9189987.1 hypothetical protein AeNC1_008035 [Aphanomyces euteiches]
MWVVGFEVTYGQALAPPGFRRVTNPQGAAAEIAPDTYLWYKTHTSRSETDAAILSIRIDTQDTVGFETFPKPILRSSPDAYDPIYLLYSSTTDVDGLLPIKELKIIPHNEEDIPKDYEWVPCNASTNKSPCIGRLCLKRATAAEVGAFNAEEDPTSFITKYTQGTWLDVFDILTNKWRTAQVKTNTAIHPSRSLPPNALVLVLPLYRPKEIVVLASQIRARISPCGSQTNLYESPAYPTMRASSMRRLLSAADVGVVRETLDLTFFDMDETYFKSILLPFIEACMAAPCREMDAAVAMQGFLHHCLKHWVAAVLGKTIVVPAVELYFVALIKLIANGYETCGAYYLPDAHAPSWERAVDLEHTRYLIDSSGAHRSAPCRSLYYVETMEYFFQTGGLRAIVTRSERQEVSMAELNTYLSILTHVKPILTPTPADIEDLTRFFHAAIDRIQEVDPIYLQDDDGFVDAALDRLDLLYSSWMENDMPFVERLELTRLHVALKYLWCPSLSHQLAGMSQLLDWVDKVQRHEAFLEKQAAAATATSNINISKQPKKRIGSLQRISALLAGDKASPNAASQPPEAATARWLRASVLAKWIVDACVLELILGDPSVVTDCRRDAHMEVWKRFTPLLVLVSQNELLTKSHLTLLWRQARKQTARRKVVYDMLLQLASSMVVPLLDAIADLVGQISLDEYDGLTIHFLTRITRLANGKAHHQRTSSVDVETLDRVAALGVNVLWTAIQARNHPMHAEFVAAFSTLLHEMHIIEAAHGRRNTRDQYIQQCIVALAAGSQELSIDLALAVLQAVIQGYVPDDVDLSSVSSGVVASAMKNAIKVHPLDPFIQHLDSKFQLIEMVVAVHPTCPAPCLAFLAFLLTHSGLVLDTSQIDRLYTNAKTLSPRDSFFEWLLLVLPECVPPVKSAVLPDGFVSNGAFVQDDLELLFASKLVAPSMEIYEYQCFERLFRYLNGAARRLVDVHLIHGFAVEASLVDLTGYTTLLDICMSCSSPRVSSYAQQFLVYLLLHMTGKQLNRQEIWLRFVEWCMGQVDSMVRQPTAAAPAVCRLLELLATFLFHAQPPERDAMAARRLKTEELMVYVKTQDGRTSAPICYTIPRTCLVGELRDRIAVDVGHFAEGIRMLTDTKVKLTAQYHDMLSLDQAQVFNASATRKSYIEVIVLKKPEQDTVGHKKSTGSTKWMTTPDATADWIAVSSWLASTWRTQLLDWLEDPQICDSVWRVLLRLPRASNTNEMTNRGVQSLPKLVYELQGGQSHALSTVGAVHVRKVLLEQATALTSAKNLLVWHAWTHIFDALDMAMHQEDIEWPEPPNDPIWTQVLTNVLSIVQTILATPTASPSEEDAGTCAPPPPTTVVYAPAPLLDNEENALEKVLVHAMSLVYHVVVDHGCSARALVTHSSTGDILLRSLEDASPLVRAEAAKTIRSLCNQSLNPSYDVVFPFCVDLLASYTGDVRHSDFFYLYGDIVDKNTLTSSSLDRPKAIVALFERLQYLTIVDDKTDHILEGLLHTLLCLYEQTPDVPHEVTHDLILELFHCCLFPSSSTTTAKCRSSGSRSIAFQLLLVCVDRPNGLPLVLGLMIKQHSFDPKPKKKELPKSKSAMPSPKPAAQLSRGPFVGLKNLGCTCYFNTVVQMGFMFAPFRELVLSTLSTDETSVLFQLQSLYAHLKGSSRPYINPLALLSVLKTNSGGAVDLKMQQDASEFLSSFLQQLESEINGKLPHIEKKFHRALGGVFSNELVAEGDRYSERTEPFHYISVAVRDRKTLLESLDSWVEGDTVSYTWDNDGEKHTLDTHKRISIQTLPECLIIHLKRFEFDFETMQQLKIHDRFEFPMALDMRRYTKEGQAALRQLHTIDASNASIEWRAPEYYEYELTGTIVHMGTAHSGHYYCYLKDPTTTKWYEFNDTLVSSFNPEKLAQECFGGYEDDSQNMKNRSAFMLVYNRRKPAAPLSRPVRPTRLRSMASAALALLATIRLKRMRQQSLPTEKSIHPSIGNAIEAENRTFWRKQYVADVACTTFTYDLFHERHGAEVDAVKFQAFQFVATFVFGTLWQCREVVRMFEWKEMLLKLTLDNKQGAAWWIATLGSHPTLLSDILVYHVQHEVQEFVAEVTARSMKLCSIDECKPMVNRLMVDFGHILSCDAAFVVLLLTFAEKGRAACKFLIEDHRLVGLIVQMMLTGDLEPPPQDTAEDESEGTNGALVQAFKPPFKPHKTLVGNETLLRLVALVLSHVKPPRQDTTTMEITDKLMLSEAECALVTSSEWMELVTHRAQTFGAETAPWSAIIVALTWESLDFSLRWLQYLMEAIEREDHDELKPYFRTLRVVLSVSDWLANERVVEGMTQLIAIMASQQKYFKATETTIDMLLRMAKRNPKVCHWLHANPSSWAWTEKWLLSHRGVDGYLQTHKTVLVKPNSTSAWRDVAVHHPVLVKNIEKSIVKFVPRLRSLLATSAFSDELYDSDDDPNQLVGRRVKVKWAKEKWYSGRVHSYDPASREHVVFYDDGDKKSYKMADKIFVRLD